MKYPIKIFACAEHLREHSDPSQNRYAFGYTITIQNHSKTKVKLISRHWIITDANGEKHTVDGKGVIGEQPVILPSQYFRYSSGTVLPTPVGTMQGTYRMQDDTGHFFDAIIPPFRLALPELVN